MVTALVILVGLLVVAGGVWTVASFGTLFGGVLMGGFNTIGTGLELILKAIAGAFDQ